MIKYSKQLPNRRQLWSSYLSHNRGHKTFEEYCKPLVEYRNRMKKIAEKIKVN